MRQSDGRPTKTVCQHCTVTRPCWTDGPCEHAIERSEFGFALLTGSRIRVQAPPPRVDSAFPGAQLRWVHREDPGGWTTRVLQQLWQVDKADGTVRLEWRDIPTVDEG